MGDESIKQRIKIANPVSFEIINHFSTIRVATIEAKERTNNKKSHFKQMMHSDVLNSHKYANICHSF